MRHPKPGIDGVANTEIYYAEEGPASKLLNKNHPSKDEVEKPAKPVYGRP